MAYLKNFKYVKEKYYLISVIQEHMRYYKKMIPTNQAVGQISYDAMKAAQKKVMLKYKENKK